MSSHNEVLHDSRAKIEQGHYLGGTSNGGYAIPLLSLVTMAALTKRINMRFRESENEQETETDRDTEKPKI